MKAHPALDRHSTEILGEHDEVGRLADFKATVKPSLKRPEGAIDGVHADGRAQVHTFVGATDVPGHGLACQRLLDAKQRGIVRHRDIGAPSHWYSSSNEALDWEHHVGAGTAVVLEEIVEPLLIPIEHAPVFAV